MKKAPKGIKRKGYYTGGDITPEEQKNGIYIRNGIKYDQTGAPINMEMAGDNATATSTNALPLTSGAEFKTSGDFSSVGAKSEVPTTQELGKDGAPKQKGGGGNKIGASLGWMQYANMAKEGALATVKKDTVTDPLTGKEVTGYKDFKGQATQTWATPTHTKVINEAKAGNYGKALLSSDPLLGNAYYYSQLRKGNENYNQALENIEKSKESESMNLSREDALVKRDAGETSATAVSTYRRDPNINSKKVQTKENVLTKFGDVLNFNKGGTIKGKGTGTSDRSEE